jgi:hypothetical protein
VPGEAKKVPQRGIRKRVLGEGEGDYLIYELATVETKLPRGTLVPIPTVPQFEDTAAALKWIRNDSGDLLAGKQVMIFRACEILSLRVQSRPTIVIEAKPKVTVNAPAAAEKSDG